MASRYNNIPTLVENGTQYRSSTVYKAPLESTEDYYVISSIGDRFDILAQEYYRDSKLWYIIASANPTVRRDTLSIEPGVQIRIPLPLSRVLAELNAENSNR